MGPRRPDGNREAKPLRSGILGRNGLLMLSLVLTLARADVNDLSHYVVNSFDPLYKDPSLRISSVEGQCGAGALPGSVMVVPTSSEIHAANGSDWR
ncbi:unnamed protein product, partial [Polarella glacialis]